MKRDYFQFKKGCLCTPPNWEMDFPALLQQNNNDYKKNPILSFLPKPSFCVCLNC